MQSDTLIKVIYYCSALAQITLLMGSTVFSLLSHVPFVLAAVAVCNAPFIGVSFQFWDYFKVDFTIITSFDFHNFSYVCIIFL